MMEAQAVQLIENHAVIHGDLISVDDDPDRPNLVTLRIAVRRVDDVEGMANFFAGDVGRTIALKARRDSPVAALNIGPVRLRAKKTGLASAFAEEEVPRD